MALWDRVREFMALQPVLEARSIDSFVDSPDLTTQLLRVQGLTPRPWRAAGLQEALGVPAVFGAVTLISNTVGSLVMRGLRNEVEIPPDERPRVIIRPDPFTIPREFYRQTAYNMATRGEAWWWIAKRDLDGNAQSVLNLNPTEITVTENVRNLLRPIIKWRNVEMPNSEMRQIVYQREPGSLRGIGPLQVCQAAISVTVEAQEWAANFYATGGNPSTIIKSALALDGNTGEDGLTEAQRLKAQWINSDNNTPKVIDPGIEEVKTLERNTEGAQMMEARMHQNGEVARMFGIPGSLLEYAVSGSSLTYQNIAQRFDDLLRRCLRPNYLRPIEDTMTDLLPRSIVSRFDVDALVLADIKTRYDTYGVGIDKGIISADEARAFEGLAPGDTDNAPVPFSPPQAIPDVLPIQQNRSAMVRCESCQKVLAEHATAPYRLRCPRCKTLNAA